MGFIRGGILWLGIMGGRIFEGKLKAPYDATSSIPLSSNLLLYIDIYEYEYMIWYMIYDIQYMISFDKTESLIT